MRSFFRPGRRAILVLLPVILIFAGTFNGTAQATTSGSGSIPTATGSTSTFYDTNFFVPNAAALPCDPPFSNATCDYYTLTATATGQVQVCTSYPQDMFGMTDFDVFVYDSNGNTVASGTTTADPECVIFNVTAQQTYVIALDPIFLVMIPTTTHTTIQFFSGTGTANGGGGSTSGQSITGGGKTVDGGQFALPVYQVTTRHGKIKFAKGALCNFRAEENPSWIVAFTGSKVHVEGQGYNNNNPVSFVADIQDNGEPGSSGSAGGPDVFTVTAKDSSGTVTCSGGGQLVDGNTQYHSSGV
jgi:hypothetical protein